MTDNDRPGRHSEVFSLLAHETRIDILLASLERWRAVHTEPRRYSELMRAVGMRDSGRFNYHLDRLRGPFVRETEEGYVPTGAATALYRAVVAHRPTETVSRSGVTLDRHCPECDTTLEMSYDRDFLTVECPTCGVETSGVTYPLPANALEGRSDDEVVRAMYDRARAHIGMARAGQCPECAGTTTTTVGLDGDSDDPADGDERRAAPQVGIACDTCRWEVRCGVLLALLSDARVAGGLARVGVPVETALPWELPTPTLRSDGDDEVTVTIEGPDGTASIVTDRSLAVRSVSVT